jgi:hypothetical protein
MSSEPDIVRLGCRVERPGTGFLRYAELRAPE